MITSTGNPRVKHLVQLQTRAKARREAGQFVAEGARMCAEAPEDRVEAVYVSESFARQTQGEPRWAGQPYEVLSDAVFAHVSDTQTPQGILCVVRMRPYTLSDILDTPGGLWVVLEQLQDPGNVGTVFRTGEAAGVAGVVMDAATADIYSPKVVRSTMGSIYRVPFCVVPDLTEALAALRARGIRVYAADPEGGGEYTAPDYTRDTAFLIGNEGNGLSEAARSAADMGVHIPMRGELESLNASVAAGILLYEADRQRRAIQ